MRNGKAIKKTIRHEEVEASSNRILLSLQSSFFSRSSPMMALKILLLLMSFLLDSRIGLAMIITSWVESSRADSRKLRFWCWCWSVLVFSWSIGQSVSSIGLHFVECLPFFANKFLFLSLFLLPQPSITCLIARGGRESCKGVAVSVAWGCSLFDVILNSHRERRFWCCTLPLFGCCCSCKTSKIFSDADAVA